MYWSVISRAVVVMLHKVLFCAISIGLPFWLYQMYFLYTLCSSLMNRSALAPLVAYVPFLPCLHIIMCRGCQFLLHNYFLWHQLHDSVIASKDTIGYLAFSFAVYSHCGLPSAHPHVFCQVFHLGTLYI